nr:MAG TPA: NikA, BACTERIAL CONJUGATION, RELAXASE, DNA [Caudoviricetes sp.]
MSPTLGRPKSESPKDTMLRVRLDEEYCKKLNRCAEKLSLSKSEIVRKGIDLVEKSIEK